MRLHQFPAAITEPRRRSTASGAPQREAVGELHRQSGLERVGHGFNPRPQIGPGGEHEGLVLRERVDQGTALLLFLQAAKRPSAFRPRSTPNRSALDIFAALAGSLHRPRRRRLAGSREAIKACLHCCDSLVRPACRPQGAPARSSSSFSSPCPGRSAASSRRACAASSAGSRRAPWYAASTTLCPTR